jgi:hypothetical protein
VAAGADPGTVQIVEIEEIPLAYLTSPAVRIRAKAAGALGGLPAAAGHESPGPPPREQQFQPARAGEPTAHIGQGGSP